LDNETVVLTGDCAEKLPSSDAINGKSHPVVDGESFGVKEMVGGFGKGNCT
jgi:hypothetical protein